MSKRFKLSRSGFAVIASVIVLISSGSYLVVNEISSGASVKWHVVAVGHTSQKDNGNSSISSILQSFEAFATTQLKDGSLSSVQYVQTADGTDAVKVVSGDSVSAGSDPVIVLEATGDFVATAASVPPGMSFPTGSVLTEVVDATNGAVEDWSLTTSPPDMSSLGIAQPVS